MGILFKEGNIHKQTHHQHPSSVNILGKKNPTYKQITNT